MHHHHILPLLLAVALLAARVIADVGTAAYYDPPYLPTACYGSDPTQFPAGNLFAAAGEGIWDNNAACGRQYQVVCLSSATPGGCTSSQTIQVTIVDRVLTLFSSPSAADTTMVLSTAAYQMIASTAAAQINIDFAQV